MLCEKISTEDDISQYVVTHVMAEESLDPWFMASLGIAFLIGLLSLFVFFWFRTTYKESALESKSGEMTGSERLEYYERQLIDMKIRLDALEIIQGTKRDESQDNTQPMTALLAGLTELLTKVPSDDKESDISQDNISQDNKVEQNDVMSTSTSDVKKAKSIDTIPKIEFKTYPNPIDYVLHLITNNITTSRDIQITMKKSREHTSRLLKKMYEDGYLERSKDKRPYTYSTTQKGIERLESLNKTQHTLNSSS